MHLFGFCYIYILSWFSWIFVACLNNPLPDYLTTRFSKDKAEQLKDRPLLFFKGGYPSLSLWKVCYFVNCIDRDIEHTVFIKRIRYLKYH